MTSFYKELPINEIELDVNNPRIKMFLEIYTGEITADKIALALNTSATDGSTSFSSLKESISVNKGIINPIIVNHEENGRYVVIEGNTRLQIYRDFLKSDPNGPWGTIRCIVYENLSSDEAHAIRLQSHLVGPRDWDPYSKAKYLHQLSEIDHLPINTIISFCGGKKTEILSLISSYKDMMQYYAPIVEQNGDEFEVREFSKFREMQNKSIIDSLLLSGHTKEDFAQWVVENRIDTAQNVRLLPKILKDKNATREFLKSNISKASEFLVSESSKNGIDLNSISFEELGEQILARVRNITLPQIKKLEACNDEESQNKVSLVKDIIEELSGLLEYIHRD